MEAPELLSLARLCRLLDSFGGRDKAIRTTQFSLILLANRMNDRHRADQLLALAKQFSRTRLICRLFSQPSLFLSFLRMPSDWHRSKDRLDTALASSTTILYLLCGWVELLGWLAEAGLLRGIGQATRWFQHSLRLWIVALTISLFRASRQILQRLRRDRLHPLQLGQWSKAERCWLRDQLVSLAGTGADFVAAVNSLPSNTLWAGKLSGSQGPALFLLASLVGLYRLWQ